MNKNQKPAVLAIALVTALLAALILLTDRPQADAEHNESAANANSGPAAHGPDHDGKEDIIRMTDAQMKAAGIALQAAAPARIESSIRLPGEIIFNEDRTAHVVPRITGVVESVSADLGQKVKKGQVLAVISSSTVSEQRSELLTARERLALARTTYAREKQLWEEKISAEQDFLQARQAQKEAEIAVRNAGQKLNAIGAEGAGKGSLNRYALRAPFDGIVVEKHLSVGESLKEDNRIFTITDLSTVWAEVAVPASQIDAVRAGKPAMVRSASSDASAEGRVSYIGSLLGQQTRTAAARIVLSNPREAWRPGLFVNVDVAVDAADVPVAVAADALHTTDGRQIVFVRSAEGFVAQPVRTGRSDGNLVEILGGLQQGQRYAAAGSFILKSELGKDAAGHDH